ncbi:hypothetical protein [Donghicola tyrosinivorans]|nr:hypothetical protein [Donghicola tyrosinivorans]
MSAVIPLPHSALILSDANHAAPMDVDVRHAWERLPVEDRPF